LEFYAHPTEWETKYSRATSDGLFVTNNAHPTAMLKRIFDACHYKKKKKFFFEMLPFYFRSCGLKLKRRLWKYFQARKKKGKEFIEINITRLLVDLERTRKPIAICTQSMGSKTEQRSRVQHS
jgi:hypothetical protein